MSSPLRRGFKTGAENIAREIRQELGLTVTDPLDPNALAEHLAVPVIPVTQLVSSGASDRSVRHLTTRGRGDFSAMTVIRGTRRIIVVNPIHSQGRRANSVVHELSHLILEHEPHEALADGGCRRWNRRMEAEADWLAGVLLVPRDAALRIARARIPIDKAADGYGVSCKLMEWRLNHSGARVQVRREIARRRLAIKRKG